MLEKQQMMPEKNRFPVVIEAYVKAKRAHSNQDDETWVPGDVAPTVNQFDQGDSRTTVVAVEELPVGFNWANGGGYGKANDGRGITENGVGPLSTSQVPAVAVSRACRRLTPLECERLQGWPDGHTQFAVLENGKLVEQADTPRYRQIGNGVASPVAAWIGKQIMRVETNV
jgi:site-specific DNA-cytosine methylase